MKRRLHTVQVRGTHGTVGARIAAGPYTASIVEHEPNGRLPRHAHGYANVTLLLSGGLTESLARREFECGPGTLFFRAPAEPHSNRYASTGSRSLIIDVPPPAYETSRSVRRLFESVSIRRGEASCRIARRIADEVMQPDEYSALAIEGLVLELIASALRHDRSTSSGPPWFDRVVAYLEAARTARVDMSQLAVLAGVPAHRLVTEFRRRVGFTPGAFHRHLRTGWAANELTGTDKPIAQVASEAGFTDQSHLTRVFVRCVGVTPAAYRKRATER
jgi:AraC-like DNA-binding protein